MSDKGLNQEVRLDRLQFMVDAAEIRAIDDFRFQFRLPSRAAATRELLRRGLAAVGYTIADGASSSDFGVITSDSVTRDRTNK